MLAASVLAVEEGNQANNNSNLIPNPASTISLIATTAVGTVVAGGDYLFWNDTRNPQPQQLSIYGYNLRSQTEFLITDAPGQRSYMASDGALLAWVEHQEGSLHKRIQGYDLRTRQTFTIVEVPAEGGLGGVAVADGVLYYQDATQGHRGLYARMLATGQEQLISPVGHDPVVGARRS